MAIKRIGCSWAAVRNPEEAKRFWTEKVGLPLGSADFDKWKEFQAPDDEGVLAIHAWIEGMSVRPGDNSVVTLVTDDIEGDVARMKAAGVEFVGEIVTEPGVIRLATFRDPDGNLYQLGQEL